VPVLGVVVAGAAILPLPLQIVSSGTLVEAATLVRVDGDGPITPGGHTGVYLMPATRRATALDAALSLVQPMQHVTRTGPDVVDDLNPVDSALLTGAGIAPYRANPHEYGLQAAFTSGHHDVHALGLLLEIYDQVSSLDLAAGRRIAVLGTVQPDGTVACVPGAADAAVAAQAAGADVVLVGPGCATDLAVEGPQILQAPTFVDALTVLNSP
jgi:hypothetical protein